MKPAPSSARLTPSPAALTEIRYSLRELLAETELEYQTGAFGQKKLRQAEIRKLFAARRRAQRADGNKS